MSREQAEKDVELPIKTKFFIVLIKVKKNPGESKDLPKDGEDIWRTMDLQ